MASGAPSKNEEELTFAVGAHRGLYETTKVPVRGTDGTVVGVLGIAHEITDRKAAEEAVNREREVFQNILDHSPFCVAFTVDGVIRYRNRSFSAIFDETTSDSIFDLYEKQEERLAISESLTTDKRAINREIRMIARDGPRSFIASFLSINHAALSDSSVLLHYVS